MKPDSEQREQLFGVHRLGDIVTRSGLQAPLTIAFHCLGSERENRQGAKLA